MVVRNCIFETTRHVIGTLDYLAPEVVDPDNPASKGAKSTCADVWGLGVLLYEFVVGRAPFEGQDTMHTYKKFPECMLLSSRLFGSALFVFHS